MKPRKAEQIPQADMFRLRLDQMLNQRHALYKLSNQIDWNAAEVNFGHLYSEEGRPGEPIRLMVGLHYLKHTYDLSDEEVVAQWAENPYWQYFCGETYFQQHLPIDPSQMTRFRKRIGEAGCEFMLGLTVHAGIVTWTVSAASLSIANKVKRVTQSMRYSVVQVTICARYCANWRFGSPKFGNCCFNIRSDLFQFVINNTWLALEFGGFQGRLG